MDKSKIIYTATILIMCCMLQTLVRQICSMEICGAISSRSLPAVEFKACRRMNVQQDCRFRRIDALAFLKIN